MSDKKWIPTPKIPRTPIPEQEPEVRNKNFNEVALGYTDDLAVTEAYRCLQCKKPLCVEGCPVGIDIPKFIRLIGEKKFDEAFYSLKEDTALPAVCGRVCPQEDQCEKVCVVGKKFEPVAIGRLERFAADRFMQSGKKQKIEPANPTGKKVAVIGGGPAGITCAGELAKKGHKVVVFEALHKPGGVLVYGIPEFRLPKQIVYDEVAVLEQMGVEIKTSYVIGKLFTVKELMEEEGFDAIFIATGAGLPYFMNIPGENLNGVYSANEYLTRSNLMRAFEFPKSDTPIKVGKNVAIIGGGNVAMDAARTAKRLGGENVYIIYRRSEKELPARIEEIHHAKEEGIIFNLLTNPIEIIGDENGWVKALKCIKMELGEPDASGRRRPVPIEGSEHVIEMDTVIMSIGQGPNPLIQDTTEGLKTNKWGNIDADENGKTSIEGVFAGGDIVTGAATVILAMGAGKKAAFAIDEYLKNK
jgi:glutamate synthase (NADPH/NADH) small chain